MDDEAETYKLWRIRKTVMQVSHNLIFKFDCIFVLNVIHALIIFIKLKW